MRTIREDFLKDSTVTVVLIGTETKNRQFVNSEIQASLWGENYNGLIGVIRDEIYDSVFTPAVCADPACGCSINLRTPGFGYDYYLPYLVRKNHVYEKIVPHYNDSDVFCALVKYSLFIKNPEYYIDQAFDKRKVMEPAAKRNSSDVPAIRSSSIFNW